MSDRDRRTALTVFLPVFVLYLWSMPVTMVLEDDSLFLLSAWFNGISHPPGYPLYTLLAHLAAQIPVATVAYKVHALGALLGALACSCLGLVTLRLTGVHAAAILTGLAYGFSELFWSQSIIAEVYALNSFLFFLAVFLSLHFRETAQPGQAPILYMIAFVCGLGLSNHWPLFVLASPFLFGILWPWHWATVRNISVCILFLAIGLLPYVWMVIRSQMDPAISFYGPIDTFREFWFMVSRSGYAGADTSITAGWADKVQFLGYFVRQFALQFGLAGFVLVVIGLFTQSVYWRRSIRIGMMFAFLGNSLLLIVMLGFDYDLVHQQIFRVFPHLAYGIAAIWLAAGFLSSIKFFTAHIPSGRVVVPALIALILGSALLSSLPLNYRAGDRWTEAYARAVLDNVEQDAIIFANGDVTTGPLAYLNLVERYRQDVQIYNGQGLLLANRLYAFTEPDEVKKQKNDQFIARTDRPVYYLGEFSNSYANYHYGLFLQVNKASRENRTVYRPDPEIMAALLRLMQVVPVDPWQNLAYRLLRVDYCRLSLHLVLARIGPLSLEYEDIDPQCRNYEAQLMMIEVLTGLEAGNTGLLKTLIGQSEVLAHQAIDKKSRSLLEYYRGLFLLKDGDETGAAAAFRRAIVIWPGAGNPAIKRCTETGC